VVKKIKDNVGISVRVLLINPGSAPRSEGGKLKRVADLRKLS
jgi:phenylacetate-CoA ligase